MNDKKALKSRRIGFPDRARLIESSSRGRGTTILYLVLVSWTSKVKVTCHNVHFSKLKVTNANLHFPRVTQKLD